MSADGATVAAAWTRSLRQVWPHLIGILACLFWLDLLLLPVFIDRAQSFYFRPILPQVIVATIFGTVIASPALALIVLRLISRRRALAYVLNHPDRLPNWYPGSPGQTRVNAIHLCRWVWNDRWRLKQGLPPGEIQRWHPPAAEFRSAYRRRESGQPEVNLPGGPRIGPLDDYGTGVGEWRSSPKS